MSILDRIVATKRDELAEALCRCSREEMIRRARDAPPARPFRTSLCRESVAVIAEIKRGSPSKGLFREGLEFDPAGIARDYAEGGAAAISVLTDATYFGGSLEDLVTVRRSVALPVLRKDFTIDPFQIYEARANGADAVLLIVAILDEAALGELYAVSRDLGMDALVEAHTAAEMAMAVNIGADLIGINNRDLRSFETRLETTAELAALAPVGAVLAGLSGISNREDVELMARSGAHAVLVGESLMRSSDIPAAVRGLVGVATRHQATGA